MLSNNFSRSFLVLTLSWFVFAPLVWRFEMSDLSWRKLDHGELLRWVGVGGGRESSLFISATLTPLKGRQELWDDLQDL